MHHLNPRCNTRRPAGGHGAAWRAAGAAGGAAAHFVRVSRSYWPGLFPCYEVAGLPRTNNYLEQFFGAHRYHERRASGRKGASPALVLRGQARLLAAAATRQRDFSAAELSRADRGRCEQLRRQLGARRQRRVQRRRFRRDPLTVASKRSLFWSSKSLFRSFVRLFGPGREGRLLRTRPLIEALEDRTVPAPFNPLPGTPDGTANGSLRADIITANGNGQDNTFNLAAGTYKLSVPGRGENAAMTGDLDLTAAHTYTFVGKGPGVTVINAEQVDRVFEVFPGATAIFRNLTITGGLAEDSGSVGGSIALGGGILDNGGAVTLDGAVVQNCQAKGANGANGTNAKGNATAGEAAQGGGIYAAGGSLTLKNNSSLLGNQDNGGNGGNGASRGMTGANGGNGGNAAGGSLYASATTVAIVSSALSSNVARAGNGGAGGFHFVKISGQTLLESGVGGIGGDGQGGGLFVSGGSLTMTGQDVKS
jgi:hypothetical protein